MCTVTWLQDADGYTLLMNRDELYTRGQALPPRAGERRGVRYVAPIDSDAGGTWIAANECGVTLCLLNRYPGRCDAAPTTPARGHDGEPESRGRLVLDLCDARDLRATLDEIRSIDLTRYRPFTLVGVDRRRNASLAAWDGARLELGDASPPVTSSSFDTDRVVESRREAYARIVATGPSAERLRGYHASHTPERGPYSVCTHRADGGTRSLTEVRVSGDEVTMRYSAGPACQAGAWSSFAIPRDRAEAGHA